MWPGLHPALIGRLAPLAAGPRRLLGVAGPPGAGKSTLVALLADVMGDRAQTVPMDGYHLAQVELERLGRADRKGAPDTFDAAGYAALLRRLCQQRDGEIVYAPDFRREIEEPVAGALPVFAQTPLVISEGNYLLLQSGGWEAVHRLFDEIWYLHVDRDLRRARLTERHMRFGRTHEQAIAWIDSNDEPNARVIEAGAPRADVQVRWNDGSGLFEALTG